MRVLMVHGDPRDPERGQGGGAEALMRDTARAVASLGHEVRLAFTASDADTDWADVVHLGSIHHTIGLGYARALQEAGKPHIWTLMDYWPFCQRQNLLPEYDAPCAAVAGRCDSRCQEGPPPPAVVGLVNGSWHCTFNARSAAIMRRHGLRVDGIVPLGVDTERFAPPAEGRDPRCTTVYASAAWAAWPTKGMHVLRQAIAGTPISVGLITGLPRADVARALQRASIYVFPSCYEETWGLCLTEAMACGCACVATDCCGAQAQIVDGETGLLVPERDPAALLAALKRLAGDADLRQRLGAAARAWAAREASLEAMGRRWVAAYEAVRSDHARAGGAVPTVRDLRAACAAG